MHTVFYIVLDTLECIIILELFFKTDIHITDGHLERIQSRMRCVSAGLHYLYTSHVAYAYKDFVQYLSFVYLSAYLRNSHLYFQDTKGGKAREDSRSSTSVQLEVEGNSETPLVKNCEKCASTG